MAASVRSALTSLVVSALVVGAGLPAGAQATADETFEATTIEFVPTGQARLFWDGRPFGGTLIVTAHRDGASVVEQVDPDTYLKGIREVPFTWEPDALAAQAVAARTYLAWTLERGRSRTGAAYGFDICASDACQVYRGLGDPPSATAWYEAVTSTSDEVLLYRGRPAQALYSSTAGGRTRNVEDVFEGSAPVPYLVAVDSGPEDSPFVRWEYVLDADDLEAVLRRAGVIAGDLFDVEVVEVPDGTGPWTVVVEASDGTRELGTWEFRSAMNRHGSSVLPDQLPAQRPDSERRYPQTIMSPSYRITREVSSFDFGPFSDSPYEFRYRFVGEGWGHNVGMSQFGAQAMATAGLGYADILAHFYGGLRPEPAGEVLPDTFRVGLDWSASSVTIGTDGPVAVRIDGREVADGIDGTWRIEWSSGRLVASPPVGFGVPPDLWQSAVPVGPDARYVVVRGVAEPASEVRLVVFDGDEAIFKTAWTDQPVGSLGLSLDFGSFAPPSWATVVGEVRRPDGTVGVWTDVIAFR